MRLSTLLMLGLIGVSGGCDFPEHDGYSLTDSGLEYRYFVLGDGEVHPNSKHVCVAEVSVYDSTGAEIFTNKESYGRAAIPMNGEADTGIYESLSLMFEGDSGSFIFPGEGLKPLNVVNTNRWVRAEIRLDRVISKAQWDVETAHPELLPDFASQEEERLSAFLDSVKQKESVIPLTGMYMFLENKGSGKRIKKGSEVLLTYKGYFLSGEKFDDTDTHKEPFMFTMGDQGQVIKGFEIGLSSLRGGDEAVFIIPSSLAFAETGSSTGIVPPYTAVVYKLKVQNVR